MIKTFKWIYKLGYDNAMNHVYKEIERGRAFHYDQAQIKSLTGIHEEGLGKDLRQQFKTGAKEHEQRAKGLDELLTNLDPKKYPNIDDFMELLS